ncbi:MAG: DUF4214 domain-containing protein [Pseudomonadales bacterium]|nr:DUF4214 domain-containing protein [Pseudomonadales bacterium]
MFHLRINTFFLLLAYFFTTSALADCSPRGFSQSENDVINAYLAFYGRAADSAGLDFWAQELANSGGNLNTVIEPFGNSREFDLRFGSLSNENLIENLYQQLFSRSADPGGLEFYASVLDRGSQTLQSIALEILRGAQGSDFERLSNRNLVVRHYLTQIENGQINPIYNFSLSALLRSVSEDTSSAETACNSINTNDLTIQITAGSVFACAIYNKTVQCWGSTPELVPPVEYVLEVPNFSNPTQIAAGEFFVCVLDDNGVTCWGENPPTLDSSSFDASQPITLVAGNKIVCLYSISDVVCNGVDENGLLNIPSLDNITDLALGRQHACAIHNGKVTCWGVNEFGQLDVPELINPTQVEVGNYHVCALDDTGVVCWGGDELFRQKEVPELIDPYKIVANQTNTCAFDSKGLTCWGFQTRQASLPLLINPVEVALHSFNVCALDDDGIECWGDWKGGETNVPEELCLKPTTNDIGVSQCSGSLPVQDIQLSVGSFHTCILRDKDPICWGAGDDYFRIGEHNQGQSWVTPLVNASDISAGYTHTCAVSERGVICWGEEDIPSQTESMKSVVPTGLNNPFDIDAGYAHSCALLKTSSKNITCWGGPWRKPLQQYTANNPVQISVGDYYFCFIDDDGLSCATLAFGENTFGQATPPNLNNPTFVDAGKTHTCAIDEGEVVCWGDNSVGQSSVPALSNPNQVSAGESHTCALDNNGVTCWGSNEYGQSEVPPLSNPTQIGAGVHHSCALDDTGVVCWGDNGYGQLEPPRGLYRLLEADFAGEVP